MERFCLTVTIPFFDETRPTDSLPNGKPTATKIDHQIYPKHGIEFGLRSNVLSNFFSPYSPEQRPPLTERIINCRTIETAHEPHNNEIEINKKSFRYFWPVCAAAESMSGLNKFKLNSNDERGRDRRGGLAGLFVHWRCIRLNYLEIMVCERHFLIEFIHSFMHVANPLVFIHTIYFGNHSEWLSMSHEIYV